MDKYKITFPIFAKISLAGEHDGKIVQRFEPDVTPDSPELAAAIEKALRGEKDKPEKERAAARSSLVAIY